MSIKFNIKSILILLLGVTFMYSCNNTKSNTAKEMNESSQKEFWVNSYKVPCDAGAGKMMCMQINEGDYKSSEGWTYFYNQIEGFDYRPGSFYKLLVNVEELPKESVPMDASSLKYSLVKILKEEVDTRYRINDIWALDQIAGADINLKNPGSRPRIEFNVVESRTMGLGGCNNFRGNMNLGFNGELSFGPLMSTKKACPDMEVESNFMKALDSVRSYKIEKLSLLLMDEQGNNVLTFKKID